MDLFSFQLSELSLGRESCRREVDLLLSRHDLQRDHALERYFGVYKDGALVAGAGYTRNVIKCVAVDNEYRGEGLLNALISQIMTELAHEGISNAFLFTKPANQTQFEQLNFFLVEATGDVLLMGTDSQAFPQYLASLARHNKKEVTGSLVMNCNPFTLGHQYLAEKAGAMCDHLLIFVVEEELSVFPFDVRLRLVEAGTAHLSNVTVLPGGPYIISAATFPTYFTGGSDAAIRAHAALDVGIFGRHICPAAGIRARYVGEEPYSRATGIYNETMLTYLPQHGVEVIVFPRKQFQGQAISASRARALLAEGRISEVEALVPATTAQFLHSSDAKRIIERLQAQA